MKHTRFGRGDDEKGPDDAAGKGKGKGKGKGSRDGGAARAPRHRALWKELTIMLGLALALTWLIKTFLLQAFSIPSDSMQNTLQRGDRVLVDKLTPWFGAEPKRGEVIVFRDPGQWLHAGVIPNSNFMQDFLGKIGLAPSATDRDLIKRTIAIGGDTVECRRGGPVTVNGKALHEPYIFPGDTPCDDAPFGPIVVPRYKIWVMGDHRQDSLDSRYHMHDRTRGFVPVDKVIGRAVAIAWPVNRWATLPIPHTFHQPGIGNQLADAAPRRGSCFGLRC